jgi:hypothetical protein
MKPALQSVLRIWSFPCQAKRRADILAAGLVDEAIRSSMKKDVKKKDFSPPLGKMRVW